MDSIQAPFNDPDTMKEAYEQVMTYADQTADVLDAAGKKVTIVYGDSFHPDPQSTVKVLGVDDDTVYHVDDARTPEEIWRESEYEDLDELLTEQGLALEVHVDILADPFDLNDPHQEYTGRLYTHIFSDRDAVSSPTVHIYPDCI